LFVQLVANLKDGFRSRSLPSAALGGEGDVCGQKEKWLARGGPTNVPLTQRKGVIDIQKRNGEIRQMGSKERSLRLASRRLEKTFRTNKIPNVRGEKGETDKRKKGSDFSNYQIIIGGALKSGPFLHHQKGKFN